MTEISNLDELKKIELDTMKALHAFCEENSIIYYLSLGTLIGAVRHKGFIPWDDDIDVFMPRDEYNRFLDILERREWKLDDRYSLVNHKTPTYYGRPMSKVIDSKTVLTEKEFIGDDPIGVFVDIWPLDGITSDKKEQEKQLALMRSKTEQLYLNISKMKALGDIKGKIKHILMQFRNRRKLIDDIEQASIKYNYADSDYVVCYIDSYSVIMDKKWFEERKLAAFEDAEFYIPGGYHEVLTKIYGDYMQLPPIEEQVPHHVINTFWREETT